MKLAETSVWIDGPKFYQFLVERNIDQKKLDGKLGYKKTCSISRWKLGQNLKLETADRVLVACGYHLHNLPDDVWLAKSPLHKKKNDA